MRIPTLFCFKEKIFLIPAPFQNIASLQNVNLDEVYGDSRDDEEPKSEISLTNPTNPYAASKAACEVIVRSYHVNL